MSALGVMKSEYIAADEHLQGDAGAYRRKGFSLSAGSLSIQARLRG
jgi:hypothetical protein